MESNKKNIWLFNTNSAKIKDCAARILRFCVDFSYISSSASYHVYNGLLAQEIKSS